MPFINYAYVNGKFVMEENATVSVFDRGFLYGDGCFETMRVYDGKIFLLEQHLARLTETLKVLQIPVEPPMRSLFRELVSRNEVRSGVVRLAVSRGQEQPTIVLTAQSRKFSDKPVTLRAIVSSVCVHTQLAQLKTANRLPYILAKQQAEAAGAEEALLLNEAGRVAELSASNIFVVAEGKLFTPPVKDGVLPGVTRAVVIELAKHLKMPVKQKSLMPEVLDTADEVFATNSVIEIAPVAPWSRQSEITTRLQAAYRELVVRMSGQG